MFRVYSPQKQQNISNNKKFIKYEHNYGCNVLNSIDGTNSDKFDKSKVIFCDKGLFSLEYCIIKNVKAASHGIYKNPDYMIHLNNPNAIISNNIISDCTTYHQFIFCEDSSHSKTLRFYSNTITNCYTHDKSYNPTIDSDYYYNDLQNNTIKYEESSKSKAQRAFFIHYHRGCKMIDNVVENGFAQDSSAALFEKSLPNSYDDLELRDCIFSNCKGNNDSDTKLGGQTIVIENLDYNLNIQNVTFTNCKPDVENTFYIRIETQSNPSPSVIFTDCNFSFLESNAVGKGGIGFVYKNSENSHTKTVKFEKCTFDSIYSYDKNTGGGAICIDGAVNEVKQTNLEVNECTFSNITSSTNGGAIYFGSQSEQLIVQGSHFTDVHSTGSIQLGGAIYTKSQRQNQPISILNCYFTDTTASQGGAIYIERDEETSSEITISGCHTTNTKAFFEASAILIANSTKDNVIISYCNIFNCFYDSKMSSVSINA